MLHRKRVVNEPASPAHPRDRHFRVVAELLRHPFGATTAAEPADGFVDGFTDLPGAGFLRALQC